MPTVAATLLAPHRAHSGWLMAAFAFLLISWVENSVMADELASSIDLGAVQKNIRQDIRQLEQDRPKEHAGKSSATTDMVALIFKDRMDSAGALRKWDDPAEIEEIPDGNPEAGRPKHYVITTFLPFQICVLDNLDGAPKQSPKQYFLCKNIKF